MIKAIYARYNTVHQQDCETLAGAAGLLQRMDDEGECYALAAYDPATQTAHMINNTSSFGEQAGKIIEQKKQSIRALGYEVLNVLILEK